MASTIDSALEYRLDNGLVVALQNTPTGTIAAKLRVNYGPFHEKSGEEGLAHFLEHCLVTGGSAKYSPLESDRIRSSFGELNAVTSLERTSFQAEMLPEDLINWLDYTSDHIFNPRLDTERFGGERGRVLREIFDEKSGSDYKQREEFNRVFFRGHPKGISGLGKESVVTKATPEILRGFHSRGYHPNNMDLILVGKLPSDIKGIIHRRFGVFSAGDNPRVAFPQLSPLQEKTTLYFPASENINHDTPQESSAYVSVTYQGPVNGSEDESAVRFMNHILAGDTNSFLFKDMGLGKGLAYRVHPVLDGRYNAGALGINAVVPATRIEEAVRTIFENFQIMKDQKVDTDQVERVRRYSRYVLARSLETNSNRLETLEIKLDEGLTADEIMEGYMRVTPERILEVANKYLPDRETGKYVLYIKDPLYKSKGN